MLKQLVMVLTLAAFFGAFALAQEKPETEKKEDHKHMEHMPTDSTHHGMCCDKEMDNSKGTVSAKPWNEVCPVMGNEVDPEVPTLEFEGKAYGFCCSGCDDKFRNDPEKYSKNLSEDGKKFVGKK
ncbi:MAG: YHS domain-containing protein [Ignavibacteriaceae bacterium]|nr:YHS domain-containing protein [Ignavibacteriaceae bacterium]